MMRWRWAYGWVLAGAAALLLLAAALRLPAHPPRPDAGPGPGPARLSDNNVSFIRDIEYARVGGGPDVDPIPLLLDLYLPPQPPESPDAAPGAPARPPRRYPLVMWIHGGAWFTGSKESGGTWPQLVRYGFVVASINYRWSTQAPFPAQLRDCQTAIRFLRAHADQYQIDPEHVGVWGVSSGAHLAAMLATCPEESGLDPTGAAAPDPSARVQAVCDWFGPTDLWRLAFKDRQQYAIMSLLLGGNVAEHRDRATAASPLTYIRKGDPPFLIMHGDADPLVPLEQSVALDAALRQAGVESELRILPGAGHWTSDFETPEVLDTVARFFTKHLKPAAAGPAPAAPAGVGK